MTRTLHLLLLAQFAASAAWCQTGSSPTMPPLASPGAYLLQALFSLLLVIALIYGAYFALRRFTGAGLPLRRGGPAELIQTLPLGTGQALHVVKMEERRWLIVTGPGGVQITPVEGAETEETGGEGDGNRGVTA